MIRLLHPIAPHMTEELWERRGHVATLLETDWPEADESKLHREHVTLVVQVDGKLRDRIEVDAGASEREVRELVLASPKIVKLVAGREVARTVVVAGRLVNVVIRKEGA